MSNGSRFEAWKQQRLERLRREGPDQETFTQWRSPRFGTSNPQNLTNRFWTYAIRHGGDSHSLNQDLNGPDEWEAGPCFSFQRYGAAQLTLKDGRRVLIGGAHEDFYDPGFCIYNDVVVIDGDAITVYGYPENVFPPTDYATATQVGDEIWIIGNLGYQEHRCDGPAQVRVLNIHDWSIRTAHCTGDDPGSLWGHRCELSSDGQQLLISGGQRHCELVGLEAQSLINPNLYVLELATSTWAGFHRDGDCQQWLFTPNDQGNLNATNELVADAIPAHNLLHGTLVEETNELLFRRPLGRLDDQVLQIKVENRGRTAMVSIQGPLSLLATDPRFTLEQLLTDLKQLLGSHFACAPLEAVLLERKPQQR